GHPEVEQAEALRLKRELTNGAPLAVEYCNPWGRERDGTMKTSIYSEKEGQGHTLRCGFDPLSHLESSASQMPRLSPGTRSIAEDLVRSGIIHAARNGIRYNVFHLGARKFTAYSKFYDHWSGCAEERVACQRN